jgi:hypothetical protein
MLCSMLLDINNNGHSTVALPDLTTSKARPSDLMQKIWRCPHMDDSINSPSIAKNPGSTEQANWEGGRTKFQKVCGPIMHPNHRCVHIKWSLELCIFDKQSCEQRRSLDRLCDYTIGERAETRKPFDGSLGRLGIAPKVVKQDSCCDFPLLLKHVASCTLSKHASEHMDDCFPYKMPHIFLGAFQEVRFRYSETRLWLRPDFDL